MFRKWNRILAFLLSIALVTTTFGSDFASAKVYAEEIEIEENTDENSEEDYEESEEDDKESEEDDEESTIADLPADEEIPQNASGDGNGEGSGNSGNGEFIPEDGQNGENGAPVSENLDDLSKYLLDEDGNVVLDEFGNPVLKEQPVEEETEEEVVEAEEEIDGIKIYYVVSDEDAGSVSKKSEVFAENKELEGSIAEAFDGYEFVNWTDEDGNKVCDVAHFLPTASDLGVSEDAEGEESEDAEGEESEDEVKEITFIANFEATVDEGPSYTLEFKESKTVNGIKVSLWAAEGVIPDDAVLDVQPLSASEEQQVTDLIDEQTGAAVVVEKTISFDINIYAESLKSEDNEDGKVQPKDDGTVQITFENVSEVGDDALSLDVYHVEDDLSAATEISGVQVIEEEEKVLFDAEHFSTYTIAFTSENGNQDYITLRVSVVNENGTQIGSDASIDVKFSNNAEYTPGELATNVLRGNDLYAFHEADIKISTGGIFGGTSWVKIDKFRTVKSGGAYYLYAFYDDAKQNVRVSNNQVRFVYTQVNYTTGTLVIAIRKDGTVPSEPSIQYETYYYLGQAGGGGKTVTLSDYFTPTTTEVEDDSHTVRAITGVDSVSARLTQKFKNEVDGYNKNNEYWNKNTEHVDWYVIKYQGSDKKWHIDGVVRKNRKVHLDYEKNIPAGATANAGMIPYGKEYDPNTSVTVEGLPASNPLVVYGYTFAGWNTKADGTGDPYPVGKKFKLTSDLRLYAQWTAKDYTVEFDMQGHGTQIQPKTVKYNQKVVPKPADPSEAGYTFGGWFKEKECKNAWDFSNDVVQVAVVTLYAKWTPNTNTKYRVDYYQQNLTDSKYTFKESVPGTGTTGNPIPYDTNKYEGFTFDHATPANAVIKGDGTGVVSVYYKRNTTTAYIVKYYQKKLDGSGYDLKETVPGTGTTGAAIKYDQNRYVGFTFESVDPKNPTIGADGKTVVSVYYKRNTTTAYIVKYYQKKLDGSGYDLKETVPGTGTTGNPIPYDTNKYEGFTFDHATPANAVIKGDGTGVVSVYYKRNTTTAYIVKYYQKKLDGSGYDLKETVPGTGTTGAAIKYDQNRYVGFTFESVDPKNPTIGADGKTVVSVYYKRNTTTAYIVKYYQKKLDGSGYDLKETVPGTGTTGAAIKYDQNRYVGFTFESVDPKNPTIGADGKTVVSVYYKRNTTTAYIVKYYQKKLDGSGYDLKETVPGTGTTGAAIKYDQNRYVGFTFESVDPKNPTIGADGKTVVSVYYKRNTTTAYTVKYYQKKLDGSGYDLKEIVPGTGTTGAAIKYDQNRYVGFIFESVDPKNPTIGADGKTVVSVYYKRNIDTAYTVKYYQKKLDGSGYDLKETVPGTGTTGAAIEYDQNRYVGFTFESVDPKNPTIGADGNTVVSVYYKRNIDTAYTVKYYQKKLDGSGYDLKETVPGTGTTGAAIEYDQNRYVGFTFESVDPKNPTIGADGNTVVSVYYKRNIDTAYTVKYYQKKLDGSGYDLKETVPGTGTTGAAIEYDQNRYVGFTFESVDPKNPTIGADGNTVVSVYYKRNIDTAYTVKYYQKKLDGSGYDLKETVPGTGTTGAAIEYDQNRYVGFTFESVDPKNPTIGADGNTVVSVYYKRNIDTAYTVKYYQKKLDGSGYDLKETVPGTGTTGAAIEYDQNRYVGFTFESVDPKNPTIGADGNTVVSVYYKRNIDTAYTVKYYQKKLDGSGYDLKETVPGTGTTGAAIEYDQNRYVGFTFESVDPKNPTIGADGNTVVSVYYKRNEYKVSYTYLGNVPTGADPTKADLEAAVETHLFGEDVTIRALPKELEGYQFDGWKASVDSEDQTPAYVKAIDFVKSLIGMEPSEATLTFPMPAHDVVFTGEFKINKYDIVYKWLDKNGKDKQEKFEQIEHFTTPYPIASNFDDPEAPSDKYFVEWQDEEGNVVTRTDLEGKVVKGSATYTAVYEAKTAITITADTDTDSFVKEYDGNPIKASFASSGNLKEGHHIVVKYVTKDDSGWSAAQDGVSLTEVGSVTFKIPLSEVKVLDEADNDVTVQYAITADCEGTLTVNPRTITLVAVSDEKYFDGTALTKAEYYIGNGEFVGGDIDKLVVYVAGSRTYVGESANRITEISFGPTSYDEFIDDSVDIGNYIIKREDGTLKVNSLKPEDRIKMYIRLNINDEGINDKSEMYDGKEHEITVDVDILNEVTESTSEIGDLAGVTPEEGEAKAVKASRVDPPEKSVITALAEKADSVLEALAPSLGTLIVHAAEKSTKTTNVAKKEFTDVKTGVKYEVSGIVLNTEYGIDVDDYYVSIDTSAMSITLNEIPVSDQFDVKVVTPDTDKPTVVGAVHVTKRDVVLTSESASQEYNGSALTRPNVTQSGSGFVDGEIINLRATGTIVNQGTVENTIVYDYNPDNAQGAKYLENEELFANNYAVTLNNGTLSVFVTPGDDDDDDDNPGTTTIPDAPVALAPTPTGAVLGAQRETGDGPAVLGARRAGTDDETNRMARVFAMVAAAAIAVTMMITGKKKDEEEEG